MPSHWPWIISELAGEAAMSWVSVTPVFSSSIADFGCAEIGTGVEVDLYILRLSGKRKTRPMMLTP